TAETLRYYIGGYIPYVPGAEEGTYVMLGTVPVNNATYCDNKGRTDSFNVNHDYIDGLKSLNVYTVNDKGIPDVLGYQENSITDAIRIISGVDMLYYNSIGYNLVVRDADGKDVTDSENANQSLDSVNYAVNAEDRNLYADKYGYSYFAALEILPGEGMDRIPAGYSIEVTPYVTIGEADAVLNGETVIINVTETGFEFAN
ncbi:MAG: hypothetical protein IJW79_05005, partial [Clostridia bacterium]|nr:hypothetical protein [Clostridia bacterium]